MRKRLEQGKKDFIFSQPRQAKDAPRKKAHFALFLGVTYDLEGLCAGAGLREVVWLAGWRVTWIY
jgi:hypothetical protein